MEQKSPGFESIDEYIASFPAEVRAILEDIRATIKAAAPDAEERISYQMPAFAKEGILVYFAAFKRHIGFFPTSSGVEAFKAELSGFVGSKGSVRFPLDKPMPHDLIKRMVKFRVEENLRKAREKKTKKTS